MMLTWHLFVIIVIIIVSKRKKRYNVSVRYRSLHQKESV